MSVEARRIVVHGRVQGVGFRYFVHDAATRLGLRGNVRNCTDRTVEIEVEGSLPDLEAFISEVREGPPLSRVARLEIQQLPPGLGYASFLIEGF